MSITFPTTLDALNNPGSSDNLDTTGVVHDVQHADANDAIEALEAKVGVNSSAVTTSHDYKIAKLATRADVFGNGGDGALVYDGSTTILGMAPAANVYSLTRPIFASALTVNAGVRISTGGFRIFCSGTLTIAATGFISNDGVTGNSASGATGGGTKSAPNNLEYGTITPGGAGTSGTTGASTTGATTSGSSSMGGGGGGGGGGGDGSGGTASASGTSGTRTLTPIEFLYEILRGFRLQTTVTEFIGQAGARGGRGAGDGSNSGGGGGGAGTGAGAVVITAATISNSGTISANGGNGGIGGTPPTGNCGGGGAGGGGGGGFICLAYKTLTAGTITVTGGTKGNAGVGVGTGSTAAVALDGSAGTVLKYNFTTGAWE